MVRPIVLLWILLEILLGSGLSTILSYLEENPHLKALPELRRLRFVLAVAFITMLALAFVVLVATNFQLSSILTKQPVHRNKKGEQQNRKISSLLKLRG